MLIIAGFLLGAFALSPMWTKKNLKTAYLLIIFVSLVFITGFRSLSFYTDTRAYYSFYQNSALNDVWEMMKRVFVGEGKDPFYHFTTCLMANIGVGFRGWLIIISCIYYGGFVYVLKRFSNVPFVVIFGLVALSYVFFTMTGIRQTIAMGFTFFAFVKAYDRKLVQFLIFTFLGALFHSSAWIFILAYIMMNRKFGWLQIGLILGAIVIMLLFPAFINTLVRELAWNEDLAAYADKTTGLSVFGYLVQLLIAIGSIFVSNKSYFKGKEGRALLNMVVLGLVFQTFVLRIDNIFRLSMYFSVYGIILLSNAIEKQKLLGKRDYMVTYIIVALAFIAYMLYAGQYSGFSMFGGV